MLAEPGAGDIDWGVGTLYPFFEDPLDLSPREDSGDRLSPGGRSLREAEASKKRPVQTLELQRVCQQQQRQSRHRNPGSQASPGYGLLP